LGRTAPSVSAAGLSAVRFNRLVQGVLPSIATMGIDATIPENVPASRYNRIVYFNQGKVELKNYLGASGEAERGKLKGSAAKV
jgi:hypothetical protein